MTTIQYFGHDRNGLPRGGVSASRDAAALAEDLYRQGWESATLLQGHHDVVGWVGLNPDGGRCTWFGQHPDPAPVSAGPSS
jgi:hypothetical protein